MKIDGITERCNEKKKKKKVYSIQSLASLHRMWSRCHDHEDTEIRWPNKKNSVLDFYGERPPIRDPPHEIS